MYHSHISVVSVCGPVKPPSPSDVTGVIPCVDRVYLVLWGKGSKRRLLFFVEEEERKGDRELRQFVRNNER